MYAGRRNMMASGPRGRPTLALAARTVGRPRQYPMLALSARTFISHDPPIAEPDEPEHSKREAEKQKRINLEGTSPSPPLQRLVDKYCLLTEAIVKADRSGLKNMHEMQELTIETIEKREEVEKEVEKEIETSERANDAVKAFAQESKEFPAGP